MSRSHFILGLAISSFAALALVSLAAWATSGAWSPNKVRWFDLMIVLPLLVAAKLGLGRSASLALGFIAYFLVALAAYRRYIRRTSLEVRPYRGSGGKV